MIDFDIDHWFGSTVVGATIVGMLGVGLATAIAGALLILAAVVQ